MTALKKPIHLPECELINTLIKKVNKQNSDFNYIAHLDSFRKTIADESRFIVQVFPEYTLHDIEYHLNNLFKIADTLIGKKHYELMNTSELFLLCVGLYGHDWGMAVSSAQKKQLFSQISLGTKAEKIEGLLKDESQKFLNFLSQQGYSFTQFTNDKENVDNLWSKYVRETHAERSGERVNQFFLKEGSGIAESANLICKGHTIKFEILDDDDLYSTHSSVLGEPVNIKAITLYCRLIDLFDFADNRTPYVIWKYVSPDNPESKLEWAKHRALRQITCQTYNKQRRIVVNGSTDDHEVYAALKDLQNYCEDQVRRSQGIFGRMNDPRHDFDIFDINWKVKPDGFEPISVRFEFDRERMFTILSDEIYQGDPYVFLRELLQNSIDAINVRKKLWQDKGKSGGDFGVIKVKVVHKSDGDTEIIWTDDGIGMDKHIIENYLAVAGKSYYVSEEFEKFNKIGISFDPISRYGIGILTCFFVADQIEILTYKDPYSSPNSYPLKVKIPDKTRQFRVEKISNAYPDVGTTVYVFVNGKKISQSGLKSSLNVTEYLKIVAGFVEFPIIIEEGDINTIILHPDYKEDIIGKYRKSYQIFQLSKNYPWKEAIVPQDLHDAEDVFSEKIVDLKIDLELNDFEGWITYLIPKSDNIEILHDSSSSAVTFFFRDKLKDSPYYIRWNRDWEYDLLGRNFKGRFANIQKRRLSRSSSSHSNFQVYYNGIFVADAEILDNLISRNRSLPKPKIIVNIKKSHSHLDLSRNQFTENNWFSPVSKAICNQNFKSIQKLLLNSKLPERWYGIGRSLSISDIDREDFFKPEWLSYLPIPYIEAHGKISFKEFNEIISGDIVTIGEPFEIDICSLFSNHFIQKESYDGILNQWIGKPSVPIISILPDNFASPDSINQALRFSNQIIEKFYRLDSIEFINSPWEGNPPIIQKIFKPITKIQSSETTSEIFKMALENPNELTIFGRSILNEYFSSSALVLDLPTFLKFPPLFQKYFAYGLDYINLDHPLTQKIIQTGALITLLKIKGELTPYQLGELDDVKYAFTDTDDELNYIEYSYVVERIRHFWETCRSLSIITDKNINSLIPSKNMFIPNTIGKNTIRYGKKLKKVKKGKNFGNAIEKI